MMGNVVSVGHPV